jgi:hypothetical protein
MKHFLFLLLFTYTSISFSQTEPKSFKDKFEEFEFYAKPSPTNDLSRYFRNHIDSRLIDAYKLNDTVENKNHIYLTFHFNKENKVTSISVNSPYYELNKSITDAFKDFDIEKLNIPEKNRLNIYALQILSKQGDKMVVNCSTNIIYDRYPVYEGCESTTSNSQMKSCINKLLEAHIANNISPVTIKKAKVLGSINLKPKFIINEKGAVEIINSKAPIDSLTIELNRVVALFPNAITPPLRNGKPSKIIFSGNVRLEIASENKEFIADVIKSKDSTLNSNNELALHFKKFLSEEELRKKVFAQNKETISISFSINKIGKPIEVKANSSSTTLNNRLVGIFNNFPIEKLNIKSTNALESYHYTIITKGYPINVIQCNENPNVFIPVIFNKTCDKSDSPEELKNCFWDNVKKNIHRNFDTKLLSKTNLSGEVKVHCSFQIDSDSKIINIKVQAPNPIIANEIEDIIKSTLNVYKPAFWNGKAVTSSFRISIPIKLSNSTSENSFESLNKSINNKY